MEQWIRKILDSEVRLEELRQAGLNLVTNELLDSLRDFGERVEHSLKEEFAIERVVLVIKTSLVWFSIICILRVLSVL